MIRYLFRDTEICFNLNPFAIKTKNMNIAMYNNRVKGIESPKSYCKMVAHLATKLAKNYD